MDFVQLRKQVIEKYFSRMNDRQLEAVTTTDGPLLILAGAGSGKTTVLVNRIANLIKFGKAYSSDYCPAVTEADCKAGEDFLTGAADYVPNGVFSVYPVRPWNILAITFTNKAAGELRERISAKLGEAADDIWVGTFHSICGRLLRKYAQLCGHSSHFTIYDTDDSLRLIKQIIKAYELDEKLYPPKSVLSAISSAKDKLISPAELLEAAGNDRRLHDTAEIYKIYQKRLLEADAMDFDDMIFKTVKLLQENSDVLYECSEKFRYVMVDEYQDTSRAQYKLVSLLASAHNNLCVVGDDDQSIYRFRGATIENILDFEKEFKNARVIRLEQNYRSTQSILDAANAIIANNRSRKGKTLWTANGRGEKITVFTASDERSEAAFIAEKILEAVKSGGRFCENAVLYRMNAQSRSVESVFVRSGIPYRIIGGHRFFDRKEIKDVTAYLQLINNNSDDLRLRRIINEPKRGIGEATVNNAARIAAELGCSIFEVISHANEYAALSRAATRLMSFCDIINELTDAASRLSLSELLTELLDKIGYREYLSENDEEPEKQQERLENVAELASNIAQYELEADEPSLSDFLEQVALVNDIDSLDTSEDRVILMTVHSAKGLEFDNVMLIGMEEGIFPGNQSIYGGAEELEEERRLAYVAVTRAKKTLTLTNAYTRMLFGSTTRNMPSRFLNEIPPELCSQQNGGIPYYGYAAQPQTGRVAAAAPPVSSSASKYSVGQTVLHGTFGEGTVLSIKAMGNDTLLEIAFDTVGTKKLMANYAKLTVL